MLLDLSRFRGTHDHIDRVMDPSGLEAGGEPFRVVEAVRLVFDVNRDGTSFRLVGRAASVLELTCSRCVEAYRWPVAADFDLLYLPEADNTGEGDLEVQDEDLNVAFYRAETIDLGQMVREQFYLAVPMKPLCADTCRGLCPACGTNLNNASCECRREWSDPRLSGLKVLATDRDPADR